MKNKGKSVEGRGMEELTLGLIQKKPKAEPPRGKGKKSL